MNRLMTSVLLGLTLCLVGCQRKQLNGNEPVGPPSLDEIRTQSKESTVT